MVIKAEVLVPSAKWYIQNSEFLSGGGRLLLVMLVTPHAQRERGKVIDRGVHIYIYVCGRKKYLIDSPFQTLIVGLLVEFID